MKIVIASGGTGGHIYPGVAIAEALEQKDLKNQILFIGSEEGIESRIMPFDRFSFQTIKARGMLRKLSLRTVTAPFFAIMAVGQALKILKSFKPDVLITTGGYVSFPVAVAAKICGIPIVAHEQNVNPGITNRIIGFLAKKITVSFEETLKYFSKRKTVLTGNPVRTKIIKTVKSVAIQKLGLDQNRKVLLVIGGSQGARSINEAIVDLIPSLCAKGVQIIHVTGERDYEFVLSRTQNKIVEIEKEIPSLKGKKRVVTTAKFKQYHAVPYMYNIWDGLAASDLVVSRAGGTAIAEITAKGLASILVPFPYSAEAHQDKNANALKQKGAAVVLSNNDLKGDKIALLIDELLSDNVKRGVIAEASRRVGRQDAGERVVSVVYDLLGLSVIKKAPSRARRKKIEQV